MDRKTLPSVYFLNTAIRDTRGSVSQSERERFKGQLRAHATVLKSDSVSCIVDHDALDLLVLRVNALVALPPPPSNGLALIHPEQGLRNRFTLPRKSEYVFKEKAIVSRSRCPC
ncbi:hypothetical protein KOW79_011499 [Hemibagrus wyckioides]|uniref:Uncharacterized protein n=1 Tax=Hemibagrus wyckioides TaxID=337641 RepID=A0A9D3NPY3_9TELE|nr:hypothetical protein KOW79_011499 [Hemibagrus wyckioides]